MKTPLSHFAILAALILIGLVLLAITVTAVLVITRTRREKQLISSQGTCHADETDAAENKQNNETSSASHRA